jgi:hypothetical protein
MVVYVLSVGPAQWFYIRLDRPRWYWKATEVGYAPLVWVVDECPFSVGMMYRDYVKWWVPRETPKKGR